MSSFSRKLSENWKIQSSEKIAMGGEEISSPGCDTDGWIPTEVPSTVLASLVKNKLYKDPYFGSNLKDIPREDFLDPWWYRCSFELDPIQAEKTILISFEGLNYKANIWLNGRHIATPQTASGTYRRIKLNITENVVSGNNILAVEIIPPEAGDFSIGFVDWNIYPPDQNMGIFREVKLHIIGAVSIENPFVETKVDLSSLKEAALTITADLVNHSKQRFSGTLEGSLGQISLSKAFTLDSGESKQIKFSPQEFPALQIKDPELWWPYQLGNPAMHNLVLSAKIDDQLSDQQELRFGIRDVDDYINEGGHRGFKINGKKVLIKGAGWTDDLFLQDTHESLEAQVAYVKHMNLNCIRLEGFWGKDQTLYELCDQYGILMMVGWSCHWEHEDYLGKPVDSKYGGVIEPHEIDLIAQSWEDQLLWLRNHPAIFVWTVGSDKVPHPELEKRYIQSFKNYDTTRPYLNSTGGVGSEQAIITDEEVISVISGSSRVKMLGPYAYTPPVYWYTDKKLGGAYGFNTETGPGANVPPLESIKKMIPEDHLWPIDPSWELHCGLNEFRTLDRFQEAIDKRYGKAKDVSDFAFKAQVLNYELMRPMFEAFQVNKSIATGVIQWMLNSALPSMYWQLYDSYLMPNGAFYGAKKACEPLHLLYNYGLHSIAVINDHLNAINHHRALIRIYDINSSQVLQESVDINVPAESASEIYKLPASLNLSNSYFLDLRLMNDAGIEVGSNFYWLSSQKDELDYDAEFEDWAFYTPSKVYADHSLLHSMPEAKLKIDHKFESSGDRQKVCLSIENTGSHIAFFLELNISGEKSGESILPVLWDDNYISLLPGETRKIQASFAKKDRTGDHPVLTVSGWNFKQNENK
jgi:exo-1,4-beta-D-glucosaminidase